MIQNLRNLPEGYWKRFRVGIKVGVISDLTLKELENAPLSIRTLVEDMPKNYVEYVTLDNEAVDLAFNISRREL